MIWKLSKFARFFKIMIAVPVTKCKGEHTDRDSFGYIKYYIGRIRSSKVRCLSLKLRRSFETELLSADLREILDYNYSLLKLLSWRTIIQNLTNLKAKTQSTNQS